MNFNDPNDPCNTIDQYIQQTNQFDESIPPEDLIPRGYQVPALNGYKQGKERLTRLQKSCDCNSKLNASTSMTRKDDYETDDETQWYQTQDFVSNVGGNQQQFENKEQVPCGPCRSREQQVSYESQQQQAPYRSQQQAPCRPCESQQQQAPCGPCGTEQQQTEDFQIMYNVDDFRYDRGCYDLDQIDMNDFTPKLDNYDYSLNLPPPDEFNCCGGFFDPPPPQADEDRTSSCCSTSGRSYY